LGEEEHSALDPGCWSQIIFKTKGDEMTTTNEAEGQAADTAEAVAEHVREFASDVSRQAGQQFSRARNIATDAYEEAHEASKNYPHVTLALAVGVGFLLGVLATR
jgi:ElaB/YqjD/DUF883 family membrane-anchored ribosome-binding protein